MRIRTLFVAGMIAALAALALWAQNMPMGDMNDMPYAKVKEMLSNPSTKMQAMQMARQNHVLLMAGQPVEGRHVTLVGELTDANCYLSTGVHEHHHALCAKACVAAGSPVLFISGGKVYSVLTAADGMPLPEAAYDALGKPGVTVHATELNRHGVRAIAVQSVGS